MRDAGGGRLRTALVAAVVASVVVPACSTDDASLRSGVASTTTALAPSTTTAGSVGAVSDEPPVSTPAPTPMVRTSVTPEALAERFVAAVRADDRSAAAALSVGAGGGVAFDLIATGRYPETSIDCRPQDAVVRCTLWAATPDGYGIYVERTGEGWNLVGPAWDYRDDQPDEFDYRPEEWNQRYCVTDPTPINVRVGPGVEFAATTVIPVGDCSVRGESRVTETAANGRPWRPIRWRGIDGLVWAGGLTEEGAGSGATSVDGPGSS